MLPVRESSSRLRRRKLRNARSSAAPEGAGVERMHRGELRNADRIGPAVLRSGMPQAWTLSRVIRNIHMRNIVKDVGDGGRECTTGVGTEWGACDPRGDARG